MLGEVDYNSQNSSGDVNDDEDTESKEDWSLEYLKKCSRGRLGRRLKMGWGEQITETNTRTDEGSHSWLNLKTVTRAGYLEKDGSGGITHPVCTPKDNAFIGRQCDQIFTPLSNSLLIPHSKNLDIGNEDTSLTSSKETFHSTESVKTILNSSFISSESSVSAESSNNSNDSRDESACKKSIYASYLHRTPAKSFCITDPAASPINPLEGILNITESKIETPRNSSKNIGEQTEYFSPIAMDITKEINFQGQTSNKIDELNKTGNGLLKHNAILSRNEFKIFSYSNSFETDKVNVSKDVSKKSMDICSKKIDVFHDALNEQSAQNLTIKSTHNSNGLYRIKKSVEPEVNSLLGFSHPGPIKKAVKSPLKDSQEVPAIKSKVFLSREVDSLKPIEHVSHITSVLAQKMSNSLNVSHTSLNRAKEEDNSKNILICPKTNINLPSHSRINEIQKNSWKTLTTSNFGDNNLELNEKNNESAPIILSITSSKNHPSQERIQKKHQQASSPKHNKVSNSTDNPFLDLMPSKVFVNKEFEMKNLPLEFELPSVTGHKIPSSEVDHPIHQSTHPSKASDKVIKFEEPLEKAVIKADAVCQVVKENLGATDINHQSSNLEKAHMDSHLVHKQLTYTTNVLPQNDHLKHSGPFESYVPPSVEFSKKLELACHSNTLKPINTPPMPTEIPTSLHHDQYLLNKNIIDTSKYHNEPNSCDFLKISELNHHPKSEGNRTHPSNEIPSGGKVANITNQPLKLLKESGFNSVGTDSEKLFGPLESSHQNLFKKPLHPPHAHARTAGSNLQKHIVQVSRNSKLSEQKGKECIQVNNKSYVIFNKLGKGGSSVVYQVMDSNTSELLAIKCVDLSAADAKVANDYLNEVDLLKRLQSCQTVIRMLDYEHIQENKKLLVVMEKGDVDFATLIKSITKTKKMSIPMIVYYWTEMLNAVKDIHDQGIIHSDLKPANFLLVCGRLKLIDFGIASSIQEDMTSVIKETTTGTFNYMSPEAVACNQENPLDQPYHKISYRSDVWSLGCILYNLLYGKCPYSHYNNMWSKMRAIWDPSNLPNYPSCGMDVPVALMVALQWCLKKQPKERPTVAQLLQLPYYASSMECREHTFTHILKIFPECTVKDLEHIISCLRV